MPLKLIFTELDSNKECKTELVNITIPESKSIPSLTWNNENGKPQVALTSYDMVIKNQGKQPQKRNTMKFLYG